MIRLDRNILDARRGFTLLELVLSMGMIAMMALTLYTSLSVAFKARGSMEAQTLSVREASVVMDLLQQDFQSVLKPNGIMAGSFVGYAMGTSGAEADSVTFCSLGSDAGVDSPFADGMRKIELTLTTDGNTPVLVRRVQRNLLAPSVKTPQDEILSRNVTAFSVQYFDGSSWYTEWDSTLHDNTLPVALNVRIVLKITENNGQIRNYQVHRIIPLACGESINSQSTEEATQ